MNSRRATRLFFVELAFVILGFALCCAVCVQLFAKAHRTSTLSRDSAAAAALAQSAAACFKAAPDDATTLSALLDADVKGGAATIYYNDSWETVSDVTGRMLTIRIHQNGLLVMADIVVSHNDQALFELTVCHAMADGRAAP